MINIPVDYGYAFDYIAILYIKMKNNINLLQYIHICEEQIINQIGHELWSKILLSEEFDYLLKVNNNVFDAVEKARYGNISAKEVDSLNMKRFEAKLKLQKRFFPDTNITECKT